MSFILSYDGDGGGFSAHLLHHIVDHKIASILNIKHITVYSPIGTIVETNSSKLEKIDERFLDSVLSTNSYKCIYLQPLMESFDGNIERIREFFRSEKNYILLSGQHHIPDSIRKDPHKFFGSRNDFENLVSSCFGELELLHSYSENRIPYMDWYLKVKQELANKSLGIHIRSFFDSPSGSKEFRSRYGEFTGWLLDEIRLLATTQEISIIYIASDDKKYLDIFTALLDKFNFPFSKPKIISAPWGITHSSLANSGISYRNIQELIFSQAKLHSDSLSYMYSSLFDWFLMKECAYIIGTSSSFPATTRLFGKNKFILRYPCSSYQYPSQPSSLY